MPFKLRQKCFTFPQLFMGKWETTKPWALTDVCILHLSLSLSLSPPLFMGKWENKLNDFYGFILGSKQKDRGY